MKFSEGRFIRYSTSMTRWCILHPFTTIRLWTVDLGWKGASIGRFYSFWRRSSAEAFANSADADYIDITNEWRQEKRRVREPL